MSKHERSGWRDEALSRRHRDFWGLNCPAADLDFLMVEYDCALPVALVDYKHVRARVPDMSAPTHRAVRALADGYSGGPLPYIVAFYWPDTWAFYVIPANAAAACVYHSPHLRRLTERRFVASLHFLRKRVADDAILNRLNDHLPPECELPQCAEGSELPSRAFS